MEIQVRLELEFPSVPSLWGLGEFLFTDERYSSSSQTSQTFRFTCNYGVVSAFLPKLPYQFGLEKSVHERNTDYDTTSIWSEIWFLLQKKIQQEVNLPPHFPAWVQASCDAIKSGNMKLCESGVGGTYFVDGERKDGPDQFLSVFKPIDEEPGSPNNPKKKSFTPLLPCGGGAYREVAAFILGGSFVNIPETHLVEVTNSEGVIKKGSLQKYVQNDGDCSDVGANRFSVDDVHRIGIFDVRILNMDRNDENLLIQKVNDKEWKLLPIDHTYAFPDKIDSYFNWQFWSQTKKPFSVETLDYISSISVESDALMLLETGINEVSVRNVTASTILLQKAAKIGFNLFEISLMVSGKQNDLMDILLTLNEECNEEEENLYLSAMDRLRIFKNIVEEKVEAFVVEKRKKIEQR